MGEIKFYKLTRSALLEKFPDEDSNGDKELRTFPKGLIMNVTT